MAGEGDEAPSGGGGIFTRLNSAPLWSRKPPWVKLGALLGLVVGLVLLFVALDIVAGGHGSGVPYTVAFPYAMLISGLCASDDPGLPLVLACLQYIVYGLLIGAQLQWGRRSGLIKTVVLIVVLHCAAVLCVLVIPWPAVQSMLGRN